MTSVWGPHACVQPRALRREHAAASAAAWAELQADTAAQDGDSEQQKLYEVQVASETIQLQN